MPKDYVFTRVFDQSCGQSEVYAATAAPLVKKIFDGTSGLVFCYGVTNAGKSYTVMGTGEDERAGLLPRALKDVLTKADETGHSVSLSFFEIYNDYIYDLMDRPLASSSSSSVFGGAQSTTSRYHRGGAPQQRRALRLKDRDTRMEVNLLSSVPVASVSHGVALARAAEARRRTTATGLNSASSRSHAVCQIDLHLSPHSASPFADSAKGDSTMKPSCPDLHLAPVAQLMIVDLAGSERGDRTGASGVGATQREANHINQSISQLMRCLRGLRERSQDIIPWRESKLTHLFQYLLSPTSESCAAVAMIANVSPSVDDHAESVHALANATRARTVSIHGRQPTIQPRGTGPDHYDRNGRRVVTTTNNNNNNDSSNNNNNSSSHNNSSNHVVAPSVAAAAAGGDKAAPSGGALAAPPRHQATRTTATTTAQPLQERESSHQPAAAPAEGVDRKRKAESSSDELRRESMNQRPSEDQAAEVAELRARLAETQEQLVQVEQLVRTECAEEMQKTIESIQADYTRRLRARSSVAFQLPLLAEENSVDDEQPDDHESHADAPPEEEATSSSSPWHKEDEQRPRRQQLLEAEEAASKIMSKRQKRQGEKFAAAIAASARKGERREELASYIENLETRLEEAEAELVRVRAKADEQCAQLKAKLAAAGMPANLMGCEEEEEEEDEEEEEGANRRTTQVKQRRMTATTQTAVLSRILQELDAARADAAAWKTLHSEATRQRRDAENYHNNNSNYTRGRSGAPDSGAPNSGLSADHRASKIYADALATNAPADEPNVPPPPPGSRRKSPHQPPRSPLKSLVL